MRTTARSVLNFDLMKRVSQQAVTHFDIYIYGYTHTHTHPRTPSLSLSFPPSHTHTYMYTAYTHVPTVTFLSLSPSLFHSFTPFLSLSQGRLDQGHPGGGRQPAEAGGGEEGLNPGPI